MDGKIANGNGYISTYCKEDKERLTYSKTMTCNGIDDENELFGYMFSMAGKFAEPFKQMGYQLIFYVPSESAQEAFKTSKLSSLGTCQVADKNPAEIDVEAVGGYMNKEIRSLMNFDMAKELMMFSLPLLYPRRYLNPFRPFDYMDVFPRFSLYHPTELTFSNKTEKMPEINDEKQNEKTKETQALSWFEKLDKSEKERILEELKKKL